MENNNTSKITFEQAVISFADMMGCTVDAVLQFKIDDVLIYMKEING